MNDTADIERQFQRSLRRSQDRRRATESSGHWLWLLPGLIFLLTILVIAWPR